MRIAFVALSGAALGILQACAQITPAPPAEGKPGTELLTTCGADRFQDLVGQSYALSNMTQLPGLVRIIPWGSAVTMDYIPTRTNVELDRNDVITRIFCG